MREGQSGWGTSMVSMGNVEQVCFKNPCSYQRQEFNILHFSLPSHQRGKHIDTAVPGHQVCCMDGIEAESRLCTNHPYRKGSTWCCPYTYMPCRTWTHDLGWKNEWKRRFNGWSSSIMHDTLWIVKVWENGHAFWIFRGLVASTYTLCGAVERYWHCSPWIKEWSAKIGYTVFSKGANGWIGYETKNGYLLNGKSTL